MKTLRPQLLALLSALFLATPVAHAQQAPAAQAEGAPAARTDGITFTVEGDQLILKDEASGKLYRLHAIAAAVFALSDGKATPAEIRGKLGELTGYAGTDELVFAALDALADAKLLKARVTPPGTTPLDLVVTPDGLFGTGLVTTATAEGKDLDTKALSKEEARKKSLGKEAAVKSSNKIRYKSEAEAKALDKGVVEKAAIRKESVEKHSESSAKQAVSLKSTAKGESAQKDAATKTLAAAHAKAREAATNEASLRSKMEQAKKREVYEEQKQKR